MTDQPATLAEALAILQQRLPKISKDKTGKVEGTSQQGKDFAYQYKYADLADVSLELLPIMGELGLSFSCKPTTRKGVFGLQYKLRFAGATPETDSGFWPIPPLTIQKTGAFITYARRYILSAVTGVATGDDDDGAMAEHDQLREGTARGRVPGTKRTRGPAPAAEDKWATTVDAPPRDEPGSAQPAQLKAIHTSLSTLKLTDRDKGLTVIEQIIGHPLAGPHRAPDESDRTSKNLSWQDAEKVKKELARRAAAQREGQPAEP
jgi:hypothetical protein